MELVPGDFLTNLIALEAADPFVVQHVTRIWMKEAEKGDVLMIDAGFREAPRLLLLMITHEKPKSLP